MSFETEHKTIQMEDAISHDQLALDALERRRIALEEVYILYIYLRFSFKRVDKLNYLLD